MADPAHARRRDRAAQQGRGQHARQLPRGLGHELRAHGGRGARECDERRRVHRGRRRQARAHDPDLGVLDQQASRRRLAAAHVRSLQRRGPRAGARGDDGRPRAARADDVGTRARDLRSARVERDARQSTDRRHADRARRDVRIAHGRAQPRRPQRRRAHDRGRSGHHRRCDGDGAAGSGRRRRAPPPLPSSPSRSIAAVARVAGRADRDWCRRDRDRQRVVCDRRTDRQGVHVSRYEAARDRDRDRRRGGRDRRCDPVHAHGWLGTGCRDDARHGATVGWAGTF